MTGRAVIDRTHRWYQANARRYDRLHPGLPGDTEHYAALALDARVLELGAGTGRVTAALADVARRVIAVDNAPAMLAIAAERLRGRVTVDLVLADIRALAMEGAFDLVVLAYRTLQHVPAEAHPSLWRRLRSLLTPGGRIAFDTWHGPVGSGRDASAVRLTPITSATIHDGLAAAGFTVMATQRGFLQRGEDGFTQVWLVGVDVGHATEDQRKKSRSP
ncbi:MAG: class I SAM-dependent methyltransferase [Dehalococcoidia bacterium]